MRVLILGAWGIFGRRIFATLKSDPRLELIGAGRDPTRGRPFGIDAVAVDTEAADFHSRLAALKPNVIVHCAGPFQGQTYRVAHAAIAVGATLIDLADGREYVTQIRTLDAAARAADVTILSGASTVPALSAAAIDALSAGWRALDSIDIGVSPGNQTERGLATVRSILSYVGEPIPAWRAGQATSAFGWSETRVERYAEPVGRRALALCDVPDLALFPERYPGLRELRFAAGLEVGLMHHGLRLLGGLRRARLLPPLERYAPLLLRLSNLLWHFGSDSGAMHVRVSGRDASDRPRTRRFELNATHGDGPHIPTAASIALIRHLADGGTLATGARACVGELPLVALLAPLRGRAIHASIDGAPLAF